MSALHVSDAISSRDSIESESARRFPISNFRTRANKVSPRQRATACSPSMKPVPLSSPKFSVLGNTLPITPFRSVVPNLVVGFES
jgi:hypothetical protein